MLIWQKVLITLFGSLSFILACKGFYECSRKNGYGETIPWLWTGILVWADAPIIGTFWVIVSLVSLLINSWILFFLLGSIFWTIRSIGDTIFWFNQQFSNIKRCPPEKLRGYKFFKDDTVWFAYQLVWQCLTVFFIVASIYFARLWIISL